MRILFFLLIIFSLHFSACLKDKKPGLPPITMEGKNVFACYINGELYVANGYKNADNWFTNSGSSVKFSSNNRASISSWGEDGLESPRFRISFYRPEIGEQAVLNGKENSVAIVYLPVSGYDLHFGDYKTTAEYTGWVEILKYRHNYMSNNFVLGIFEFDAVFPHTGEVIEVREGRFDLRFEREE